MFPMMYVISEINGYLIAFQLSLLDPVYYYPAVMIVSEKDTCFYPCVGRAQATGQITIDFNIQRGFFKPPSKAQRMALFDHNLLHYKASQDTAGQCSPVDAMERQADEILTMESLGIAFAAEL